MGELVIATRSGKVLVIDENDLPVEGRGGEGVRIAGVQPGDTIVAVTRVPSPAEHDEIMEMAGDDLADTVPAPSATEYAAGYGERTLYTSDRLPVILAASRTTDREMLPRVVDSQADARVVGAGDPRVDELLAERERLNADLAADLTARSTTAFARRDQIDVMLAKRRQALKHERNGQ